MKAGLATNLLAVSVLRELGFIPCGTIHVESVISEEDGGAGALADLARIQSRCSNHHRAHEPGGGHCPGWIACLSNPRAREICPCCGAKRRRQRFREIHSTFQCPQRVRGRNRSIDHPLYRHIANKIPINIGIVRSGSWPSSVPEWLTAEGRAGLVPGEDLAEFKSALVQTILDAAGTDPWLKENPPTVEWFSGQSRSGGNLGR